MVFEARGPVTVAILLTVTMLLTAAGARGEENKVDNPAGAADAVTDGPIEPEPAPIEFAQAIELIGQYCLDCHNSAAPEAGIDMEAFVDLAAAQAVPDSWEKIRRMVDFGAMPPEDMPQPEARERQQLVRWIDREVLTVDCGRAFDPGQVTLHRLNRLEYNNTIRDLFGLSDYRPADTFPSDEVGGGFDNNADVLSLPPLLFEKYLNAAEQTAGRVVSLVNWDERRLNERDAGELTIEGSATVQGDDFIVCSSAAVISGEFEVRREGRYVVEIRAAAQQAGDELARMSVAVDDQELVELAIVADDDSFQRYRIPVLMDSGTHRLSVRFVNDYWNPNATDPEDRDRNLLIESIGLRGRIRGGSSSLEFARQHVDAIYPRVGEPLMAGVEGSLSRFLRRAFRRPVSDAEVKRYASLIPRALERGDTLEHGMQAALAATLVSPAFLYRLEDDPQWEDQQPPYPLNSHQLAVRLSYFLWSSMPDEQLFQAADRDELLDPQQRTQQIRRMLEDPKASALVQSFASQWLSLRSLDDAAPDPNRFPEFNDRLRSAMRRETEMFCEEVIRDDRSVLDFITGRFTYVNEPLAKLYGLEGIEGDEFQRVELGDLPRSGVLTQPSVLLLTSNPTRTSPVKRGKWIMENILGTPPPEPPPNVPTLEESAKDTEGLSFREQLELHRNSPICASCHRQMDALGFGFENFDIIGAWREREGDHEIDASGILPDGATFDGPQELVSILSSKKDLFARALAGKMLSYALGRALKYSDRCTVDGIVNRLQEQDYRLSALVLGIVESDPFLYRGGSEGE